MPTSRLWPKIRRTLLAASLLTAWLGFFALFDSFVTAAPLNERLSLDPPGSMEQAIWIKLPETYYLELAFSRERQPFEELEELIGRWNPQTDGTPVRIAWALKDRHGMPVATDTTTAKGAVGWANDFVYRSVASVQVAPGRYQFEARVLEPASKLAHLSPRLQLSLNLKSTRSWQMAILLWIMIANTFIGLPLLLGIAVYLLVLVVRHLTSGSSEPPELRSAGR